MSSAKKIFAVVSAVLGAALGAVLERHQVADECAAAFILKCLSASGVYCKSVALFGRLTTRFDDVMTYCIIEMASLAGISVGIGVGSIIS